ncbi:MAG: GFA family protein [Burkholderiales bacterium]
MRGHCLCGAVAFEVDADSLKLYRCHCSLCRRQSGTASNCAAVVPNDRFRWLAGEGSIRSWRKTTGFRSDFCAECGSPVPNALRGLPAVWVPAGLLDEPVDLEIVADFHLSSRASWDETVPPGLRFDEIPELEEFFDLLHDR